MPFLFLDKYYPTKGWRLLPFPHPGTFGVLSREGGKGPGEKYRGLDVAGGGHRREMGQERSGRWGGAEGAMTPRPCMAQSHVLPARVTLGSPSSDRGSYCRDTAAAQVV